MKVVLFLTSILATPALLASAGDYTSSEDTLAHLSGATRLVCQRALSTGYSLEETGCVNPHVAWYKNRDNSMSDATDEVAQSMVVIDSRSGLTQGVKLQCPAAPNTYLMTAHGALDKPNTFNNDFSPRENMRYIDPYPFEDTNYIDSFSSARFISPRIADPSNWSEPSTDYVLVTFDSPPSVNHPAPGLRPLSASRSQLIQASAKEKIDIYLYRPKVRFQTDEQGRPDFNRGTWANDFESFKRVYDVPQRVNKRCELPYIRISGEEQTIVTDCPEEDSVSGSSYVTNIAGRYYLVGLHAWGDDRFSESAEDNRSSSNAFLNSTAFCADYEELCGHPCAHLDDVQSEE